MPKQSAGLLLFRVHARRLEVLLVHPGGPLWAKKDEGAWSIPKGELEKGGDALSTAQREFQEELGSAPPAGAFIALEPVRQRGGKLVHAFAVEGELDASTVQSNTFTMEWPPRSGRRQDFPEVDRAEWFPLDVARRKILEGQEPLLDRLVAALGDRLDVTELGEP
jgi:predicted NUDIX family NTP pyrophosphohydrolase